MSSPHRTPVVVADWTIKIDAKAGFPGISVGCVRNLAGYEYFAAVSEAIDHIFNGQGWR